MAANQKKFTKDSYMTMYEVSVQFGISMHRLKDWQKRRRKGDNSLPRFFKLSTNRVLYKYDVFKYDLESMIFEI
jgi:hypothetical protein